MGTSAGDGDDEPVDPHSLVQCPRCGGPVVNGWLLTPGTWAEQRSRWSTPFVGFFAGRTYTPGARCDRCALTIVSHSRRFTRW